VSRRLRRRVLVVVWLGAAALSALIWLSAEATIRHLGVQAQESALTGSVLRASAAAADLERTLESTAGLNILAQARATLLERGDTEGALAIQRQLEVSARRPAFGIADMVVTDRQGRVAWSSSGATAPTSVASASYFNRLRDGATSLAIGTPRDAGRPGEPQGIPVARMLVDGKGAFAGVSVTGLDIAALSRQITQPDMRRDGLAMLMRTPMPAGADPAATAVLAYGTPPGQPRPRFPAAVLDHLLTLAMATPDGSAVLVDAASRHRFLAGWSRVDPTGLLVAILADADVALADTGREATILRAVATTLTLLVIVGAAALLLLRARRRAAEALHQAQRAQTATEAARTELERLVASLPAMVYHGDLTEDGTLTSRYITTNAARVIGWPHDRLPPRDTFLAHVDPGLGHEVAAFFAGLLKGGPDTLEYRMARPDGSWVWLRHHARVVACHPHGGEVIGSLADITEERGLRAQAAISSQLATLGEMAGGIAHELNRPLAVMVMAAHNALAALEEGAPDLDQLRNRLDRIADQGVRANRIIHHLQALSRPENEPQEEVCLPRAIEGALTLAGGALRQAHVALEDQVPATLPPVLGQAIAIEQVLVNLFTNARDALTARPPDARHLRLAATCDATHVTLTLADTGPGIPEAVLSRIFEPFFTTKGAGHGTGLGLSICHAAMREMGGSITARNTPQGAAFHLVFRRPPQPGPSAPDSAA
jgi:C4-dicarboxylate-specific signal transduction histidine kinase